MDKEVLVKRLKDNKIITSFHQYNDRDLNVLCELIQDEDDWELYYSIWEKNAPNNALYYVLYKFKQAKEELLHKPRNKIDCLCVGIPVQVTLRDGVTPEDFERMLRGEYYE